MKRKLGYMSIIKVLLVSRDKGVVADLALPFREHKAARQCASVSGRPTAGGVEFSKGRSVLLL